MPIYIGSLQRNLMSYIWTRTLYLICFFSWQMVRCRVRKKGPWSRQQYCNLLTFLDQIMDWPLRTVVSKANYCNESFENKDFLNIHWFWKHLVFESFSSLNSKFNFWLTWNICQIYFIFVMYLITFFNRGVKKDLLTILLARVRIPGYLFTFVKK